MANIWNNNQMRDFRDFTLCCKLWPHVYGLEYELLRCGGNFHSMGM